MRQKLTLITFGVQDLARSLTFYEQGLQWKRSPQSMEQYVLFPLGGIVLGLYPLSSLAQDCSLPYQPSTFSGLTLSYNAKSKQEVDDVLARVESLGATIVKPAQEVFWGGYSGYFKDPDGYLIEVAFNPFWQLDENDNLVL